MTDEAKFVLLQLYSIYLDRIDEGMSKRSASYFGSDESSFNAFFLGFNFEDYIDAVLELKHRDFVIASAEDGGFLEMAVFLRWLFLEKVSPTQNQNPKKITKHLWV